jgi:NTP pyrophosphatase (non-canonical NTP hydrolase)
MNRNLTWGELVALERMVQDKQWGEQNHNAFIWLAILGEEVGELQKAVLEAGSKQPAKNIATELIQVSAVAKAMFECGERNGWL